MSAQQFGAWAEYYAVEPWGFEIDEARIGKICSTILASQGAKVDPREFMHKPPAPAEDEGEDLLAKMKRVFGGRA